MKKMLLVDGNSLLFRAYYATAYGRAMTTSQGIPTNAVFAFGNMLTKGIEMVQPDAILVAFDSAKKNFRHQMYADYKGGRRETPQDLIIQFSIVREYLDAMNISRYEQEGIEADDIIGCMVKKYPDWDINVLSSDHDLLQLVDETTSVWLMKKGISEIEEMTMESLKEKMGLTPPQIIDLKGLMGDASDNIPGVPKVGEKTAIKLLSQYQTLEGVLEHVDEIKGKLHDNLVEFADQARMSKLLATIKTDEDLPVDINSLGFEADPAQQIAFFQKYEMHSMIKKIQDKLPAIENKKEVKKVERVEKCPASLLHDDVILVLDGSSENPYTASIYGMLIQDEENSVYLYIEDVLKDSALLAFLASNASKTVWDIKLIYHWCKKLNLKINGLKEDMMIAAFLCDTSIGTIEKAQVTYHYSFPYQLHEVYGKENKPMLPELEKQIGYCFAKAELISKIKKEALSKLKELKMDKLYYELELPLASVLYKMEDQGVLIDIEMLNQISEEMKAKIEELSDKIMQYCDEPVNLNSPKQLAELLFDKLELPSGKKRSTSIEVLEKLKGMHPIIEDLMEYRKYQKLYSTYAEGLKKSIFPDGRIHTIFNQCVTQTGRLSSTAPNLQNISVRDEEGKAIRKAFIPSLGNKMLTSDYSQIELRVLAHMAQEKELIHAFKEGLDIHTKTAMDLFDVKASEVTSLMRRHAKAVNFGIVYGISDFGLSEQLQISRKEAKIFIDKYLSSYPNISSYMNEVVEECQNQGYVTTLLNRRREIPEIHDKNYMVREFGKRAAMNAPIQGTAADLIKLAMIRIDQKMSELSLKSKMILQVHDELIFDVVPEEETIMLDLVVSEMENAMTLDVPLKVQSQFGKTWYEAK